MKSSFWPLLLLPFASASAARRAEKSARIDYSGFKGLRVKVPQGQNPLEVENDLADLIAHVVDFGHGEHMDVVVAAENVESITQLLDTEIIVEDVGAVIAEEGESVETLAVPSETWFTTYHAYADHVQFLTDLQKGFASKSEIITIGTSVEGRPIRGIHIWGSGGKGSKPAVLFHGTVHAREWISTMTVEYLAWQFLTQYGSSAAVKALVDKYDFYILPITNPDGFVYTQTKDRYWRKNRQPVSTSTCVGRDVNRNWSYKWDLPGGASTSPCSETFKGLAPGDSPEAKALMKHVDSLRDTKGIRFYIDFHSFGQYILWPFGYDCSYIAPDDTALNNLATKGRTSIRGVSGTDYAIGNSCRALYATTGDSIDYVHGPGNSTYSFTIELRDTGLHGFALPASQIQPTVKETWAGVIAMLQGF
ncbi:hypothetical protein jhhlp_008176 [Lomentospora prolificans]|uniref:Peptidase M14 domain-containing protein n=1 Tax=Lomentospora prolificans TaxID=41688 RepID=A0A2N3MZP9_9PEZI|nr:hypothetical protein jhhlp_008176 [Lomentospora prolificans]